MSSVPFFLIFFAFVTVFALWRGGQPERMTAVAFLVALAGSASVGFLKVPGNFRVVPMGLLLVDTALLLGLTLVAIRANRWWPIPVAACQLVAVLGHAGKMLDPAMVPDGYAFLVKIWSWPMVALLAYGTWAHRTRLRQGIIVLDWKPFSESPAFPIQSPSQTN